MDAFHIIAGIINDSFALISQKHNHVSLAIADTIYLQLANKIFKMLIIEHDYDWKKYDIIVIIDKSQP